MLPQETSRLLTCPKISCSHCYLEHANCPMLGQISISYDGKVRIILPPSNSADIL